ncbi:hypothetical protein PIB30_091491 [Stylosanthes scabra]|uniref:Uncharacterized protein n=1 Tax=Stylosanthes scabra TaxID=79078 RepID=A0ABU6ZT76_9FABA|nr:hypothetical protein [Stylosanthes scabra]
MARQLGFAQATPVPLSMIEIEQAHQLKIDSLDSLLAALSSNEDRKQQFKPFECVPCTMTTYYKKFIRPFDAIKSGADKLLAEDQPQRPKPAPKRKADPTGASKKTTKKTKTEKASVSSKISKTKRSTVPPAPSSPIIPVPAPEPSNVQSDASSGTKNSEGDVPPPKASDPKETQPTPLPTYSISLDSVLTHSQKISPISRRPKSPEVISKEAKEKAQPKGVERDSHASSSDTQTEVGPQLTTAEKIQPPPKPDSPHESGDFLLDIENLVAELHKATSEIAVEKTGHSDSLNKSVQQELNRAIEEKPIMDRPLTPATQYSISAEVLNVLRWLIDLLNAPIDQSVDHEVVQQKADLVTAHFRKYYVPEEAAPVEGVPLLTTSDYDKVKSQPSIEVDSANDKLLGLNKQKLKLEKELASIQRQIKEVEDQKEKLEGPLSRSKQGLKKIDDKLASIADQKKTTQEQLSDLKQAEKDELELHEKFLENQRSTRMALEDILHEYIS